MTPYEPPPSLAGEAPPAASTVREEQVRLLYQFSLVGYLATLLVVFILGAILWDQLASTALFAWFVAIALVTIARYGLYKQFVQHAPPPAQLPRWESRFLAGTVLPGIAWAVPGPVLLPGRPNLAERLSVFMSVSPLGPGPVAAGMGNLANHRAGPGSMLVSAV